MWLLPISMLVKPSSEPAGQVSGVDNGRQVPSATSVPWFEARLDTGPQNWKQYTASLLTFNTVLFVFGYVVLYLQPWMPLNPQGKGMLAPTTILHSVIWYHDQHRLEALSPATCISRTSVKSSSA